MQSVKHFADFLIGRISEVFPFADLTKALTLRIFGNVVNLLGSKKILANIGIMRSPRVPSNQADQIQSGG